jgi:hypothetical protein
MWVSILSIAAYLIPFILDAWLERSPERKKEAEDVERQKIRAAIAAGDVNTINKYADRLLSDVSLPTKGTTSDSAGQQHSADSTAQGISDLLGTKVVLRQ